MISYKFRKSHPQISEMWVKVAARLALAGDAFSLADAVEGAWLSGEAASGFTSVSSSMIGRKVIEKISNWSLFWGLLQHGIVIFEYVWHIAFCYIDCLVFWKNVLVCFSPVCLLSLQVWRKPMSVDFLHAVWKKLLNPETATPLSFWLWKVSLKFINPLQLHEKPKHQSTEIHVNASEQWTFCCPHSVGLSPWFRSTSWVLCISGFLFLRIILRLQHVWWKFWENGWTWAMLLHYSDVSKHFSWQKKRLEIHYLLFGTMLSEPLTSSSSKKQGGGDFFRTNRWWFVLVVVCLWALILGDCWLWGL